MASSEQTENAEVGAESSESWEKTRERVLERADHECRFCGISDECHREEYGCGLHVHHVVPGNAGGSDDPANLMAVCGGCHRTLETTTNRVIDELVVNTSKIKNAIDELDELVHSDIRSVDEKLVEFMENHPTFADEFGFAVEEMDDRRSVEMYHHLHPADVMYESISSEWGAMLRYGFKEGLLTAQADLHDIKYRLDSEIGEGENDGE